MAEQKEAQVSELSRANELFDKRDFMAALAEYETAAKLPHVRMFALVNRGNAFKARKMFPEAFSCYEDALDLASLDTVEGRFLHSICLNNLGAACLEARKMDQVAIESGSRRCFPDFICLTRACSLLHRSARTPCFARPFARIPS